MAEPIACWLLERRHGGDPAKYASTVKRLTSVRDRILANGALATGETRLDVGCGDGSIVRSFLSAERHMPSPLPSCRSLLAPVDH